MTRQLLAAARRAIPVVTLVPLLALAAGCAPGQGRLTGHVLFDGKRVPGGTLTFVPADLKGQAVATSVDESGSYAVQLPAGEFLVSFDNQQFAPLPPRGAPPLPKGLSADVASKLGRTGAAPAPPAEPAVGAQSGRYVKVPDRYRMAETAGLKVTVKAGDQQHDVEMTAK